jgi:hypothetical protein
MLGGDTTSNIAVTRNEAAAMAASLGLGTSPYQVQVGPLSTNRRWSRFACSLGSLLSLAAATGLLATSGALLTGIL